MLYRATIYVIISRFRKGVRVVEGCSLENCCAGNGTVGSNPTPSANQKAEQIQGPFGGLVFVSSCYYSTIPLYKSYTIVYTTVYEQFR